MVDMLLCTVNIIESLFSYTYKTLPVIFLCLSPVGLSNLFLIWFSFAFFLSQYLNVMTSFFLQSKLYQPPQNYCAMTKYLPLNDFSCFFSLRLCNFFFTAKYFSSWSLFFYLFNKDNLNKKNAIIQLLFNFLWKNILIFRFVGLAL